jgi:hypothetical protein
MRFKDYSGQWSDWDKNKISQTRFTILNLIEIHLLVSKMKHDRTENTEGKTLLPREENAYKSSNNPSLLHYILYLDGCLLGCSAV